MNPWNLTEAQERAISTVCEVGLDKIAADRLSVSPKTLKLHMHQVRKKMGVSSRLLAALLWDRYARGEK